PRRPGKRLMLAVELDLGDDKTFVRAVELVDLPLEAFERHVVAGLLDERALRRGKQGLAVRDRDRILELLPHGLEAADLDVEVRFAARDANANGRALGARDVALAHPRAARGERAPRVADHEEFALDLLRHAPSVSRGFSIVTTIMKPRTTPSPRRGACAGTYRARAPRA